MLTKTIQNIIIDYMSDLVRPGETQEYVTTICPTRKYDFPPDISL